MVSCFNKFRSILFRTSKPVSGLVLLMLLALRPAISLAQTEKELIEAMQKMKSLSQPPVAPSNHPISHSTGTGRFSNTNPPAATTAADSALPSYAEVKKKKSKTATPTKGVK